MNINNKYNIFMIHLMMISHSFVTTMFKLSAATKKLSKKLLNKSFNPLAIFLNNPILVTQK